MQILYSKAELKSIIKKGINTNWQLFWDNELKGRHLHSVQPMVGRGRNSKREKKGRLCYFKIKVGTYRTEFNIAHNRETSNRSVRLLWSQRNCRTCTYSL